MFFETPLDDIKIEIAEKQKKSIFGSKNDYKIYISK